MEFTAGGRFEVRITPSDVGKRVSVRRLTGGVAGAEKFTDTVGVLTSWDAGVLLITRRTGESVRVPESSLVAGKVVPAAPARRRGPAATFEELARAGARAWQPVESERLGSWELRAAAEAGPAGRREEGPGDARPAGVAVGRREEGPGNARPAGVAVGRRVGFTRRANSVLAVGEPGLELDEALARVRRWYEERGLPAYIQAATGAEGTQEWLCAELERRGWRAEVTAEVRIAALAPLADRDVDVSGVRLDRSCDEAWLRRYQRLSTAGASAAPAHVLHVLGSGPSVWFATVPGGGGGSGVGPVPGEGGTPGGRPAPPPTPAAIGRCVVDGRWAGFMAVEVDPARRREGLATAVMTALARRALDEGASAAWLQVESDNEAARALYEGMGFTVHHRYHHFRAP
nr:GNAT family N-acetyltransferase [Streptomyces sp. NRRL F-5135]